MFKASIINTGTNQYHGPLIYFTTKDKNHLGSVSAKNALMHATEQETLGQPTLEAFYKNNCPVVFKNVDVI